METVRAAITTEKTGIAFWMERVLLECDRAALEFAPEPVHDLRVALRRCRSIAAGFMHFDPARDWVEMRKQATRLFDKLGELRDNQVIASWVNHPEAPSDAASALLAAHLAVRVDELKRAGAEALNRFDRRKWSTWSSRLPDRAARVPAESLAYRYLALEQWQEARVLHHQALRNRSHVSFHRLRIALKKFRYLAENFLPALLDDWGPGLRDLQDLLGEMHDLHVLLETAISTGAVSDSVTRRRWRTWIDGEIRGRRERYRVVMTGKDSLWRIWRAALPLGNQLESAALERLQTWALFRDPDCARTRRVAQLALRLYDGLARLDLPRISLGDEQREILRVSALLHAVGSSGRGRQSHKESYRLIRKLNPPIGWTSGAFRTAALVVRYYKGAMPAPRHKPVRGLPANSLQLIGLLAGILRLAVSLEGR